MSAEKQVIITLPNTIVKLTKWGEKYQIIISDKDITDIFDEALKQAYKPGEVENKSFIGNITFSLKLLDPDEKQIEIVE